MDVCENRRCRSSVDGDMDAMDVLELIGPFD